MSSEIIRAEKKQSRETSSSLINSLPDDLIVDILARMPRFDYSNLSLVSKHFESIVASPELYARRSLLGCTEPCMYVMIRNMNSGRYLLCVLKANRNHLVLIWLLPPRSSFVAVGSKIYVFGGIYDFKLTTTVLSIDCRSHKVQPLPNMPMSMAAKVTEIIDKKIYIIGYIDDDADSKKKKVMAVFDTETQMWEPEMKKVDMEIRNIWTKHSVVMADKIYMRDLQCSFVYEPNENKWETDMMLNSEKWEDACLVDNILYYYDHRRNELKAYDRKQRVLGVVKGVGKLLPEAAPLSWWSHTVNYGGKLAVFLHRYDYSKGTKETWCADIALERRQSGDIWGNVEYSDVVIEGGIFSLVKSLVIMV